MSRISPKRIGSKTQESDEKGLAKKFGQSVKKEEVGGEYRTRTCRIWRGKSWGSEKGGTGVPTRDWDKALGSPLHSLCFILDCWILNLGIWPYYRTYPGARDFKWLYMWSDYYTIWHTANNEQIRTFIITIITTVMMMMILSIVIIIIVSELKF